MNIRKKIFTIFIFAIMIIGILTVTSNAATTYKAIEGQATKNISEQDYNVWATVVNSYLYENTDGTLTRVEYLSQSKQLLIETYDSSFNLKSTKNITNSLPIFGGFYSGTNYNFVVTGQRNPDEDNNLTVYRIEKYSKSWQKLGTADLKNCNTTVPFNAGSCRMVESDGTLYIETCHQMYKTSDGLNHQSNLGIEIDISTMNITYSRSNIMNQSTGYVSHSFNQFIQVENGYVYTVNHGDGILRGVGLIKREKGKTSATSWVDTYEAKGNINLNATGMTVGGFEISNNNCIVAGSSIDQDASNWNLREAQNIFVTITPKNDFTNTKKVWLTKYAKDSNIQVTTPHLVKINENKFAVMWEETTLDNGGLVKIVLIDETGKQIGSTISIGGRLSDCKPIVYKNNIIWYVTSGDKTATMFSLDISSDTAFANSNGKNVISLKNKLAHFEYSIDEYGRLSINSFDNQIKNVDFSKIDLPNWITIYSISAHAFKNATNLERLILPETIELINYEAFIGCKNLKGTVKFPKSLERIYEYAFIGCSNVDQFVLENKNTVLHDFALGATKTVEIGKTIKPVVGLNFAKAEAINTEVAEVTSDGTIKVVGEGSTNVYFYNNYGTKIASVIVTGVKSYKLGDVNEDGIIDATDAREVLKYCVGKANFSANQKLAADVNKDGVIDASDAREILKYCVGKTNF